MMYVEGYKQTMNNKLKKVKKNGLRIHFRPSDRTLKHIQLYKDRTDFQGNYQSLITNMIDDLTEKMNYEEMSRIEPSLLVNLRRERDRHKWVDLIIDENLCPREIDAICCSLQTAKQRMEREK